MKSFLNPRYKATNGLLLLSTLVFLLIQVLRFGQTTSSYVIYEFGGLYGQALRANPLELWRLISPIFVHIGWEHFLFNMLTLYIIGYQVEALFGTKKFLMVYLLSGMMGNAFVLYFTPDVVVAGASTSLFGLFGVIAVLRYHTANPYIQRLGQQYTGLLLANALLTFLNPSVSLAGHLGGLIGGALCAAMLSLPRKQSLFQPWQQLLAVLVYTALLVFLVSMGL